MRFLLSSILLFTIFSSSVYSQYYCGYLGKCVDAGQRCDRAYYYNSSVPERIQVSCKQGYYCPDEYGDEYQPTCTAYSGLGEPCGTNSLYQKCGEPYSCVPFENEGSKGTCQIKNYLAFGESCTFDDQCYGSGVVCIEGKCGLQPRTQCSYNAQCPPGTYCNTDLDEWEENQCLPLKKTGDYCKSDSQCSYDLICIYKEEQSPARTCQKQFSKTVGQYCTRGSYELVIPTYDRFECDLGYQCIGNQCTLIPNENMVGEKCNSSSSCATGSCQCTSDMTYSSSGICTAPIYQQNKACKTAVQNFQSCVVSNGCSIDVEFGPDSCVLKHCYSQFCTQDCVNESANIFKCGSSAHPACNPPSSSSILVPSFLALIAVIVALLI